MAKAKPKGDWADQKIEELRAKNGGMVPAVRAVLMDRLEVANALRAARADGMREAADLIEARDKYESASGLGSTLISERLRSDIGDYIRASISGEDSHD